VVADSTFAAVSTTAFAPEVTAPVVAETAEAPRSAALETAAMAKREEVTIRASGIWQKEGMRREMWDTIHALNGSGILPLLVALAAAEPAASRAPLAALTPALTFGKKAKAVSVGYMVLERGPCNPMLTGIRGNGSSCPVPLRAGLSVDHGSGNLGGSVVQHCV